MKRRPWTERLRHRLVLTPQERKAAACIVGAFILGLATMQYRAWHPRIPPPQTTSARPRKPPARFERVSPQPARTMDSTSEDDDE